MNTIIFWGVIAILFAILQSLGIWKHGLLCGFAITTTLLAIHYDFGNDYMAYHEWYEDSSYEYMGQTIFELFQLSRDPGWDLLNMTFNRLFGAKGFYIMVAIMSCIEGFCYYAFIRTYTPSQWYWLAMALYVLNNHFFILTFSMMRQSLVMAVLLLCFSKLLQKKILTPLILILLLSTIHSSVLLCLPLLIIPFIPTNNQQLLGVILIGAWLLFLLSSHILEPILKQFATLTDSFARYVEVYTTDSEMTFGIGYALRILPFLYLVYCLFTNRINKSDIHLTIIWSITIILIPFGQIIPLFARLLFYFELAELVVIAKLCSSAQSKLVKIGLTASSLIFAIYTLYTSFYSPSSDYYEPYLNFQTIFEYI